MSSPGGPLTLEHVYQIALAHHQAGRLAEAESIYRQILSFQPDHADTLHLLGLIEHQQGRHAEAATLITRSLALNPHNVSAYSNLAEVHKALGRWDEAQASCERALALDPRFANAHNNLGTLHLRFRRFAEARRCFETALSLQPDDPQVHHNLGQVCEGLRQPAQAQAQYERALTLRPDLPESHHHLGRVLAAQHRGEEAIAHLRRTLELRPGELSAYNSLAGVLNECLQFGEARAVAERALAVDPACTARASLAASEKELGLLDAALANYRRVVEQMPTEQSPLSNLIHALHFHPATTSADLRAECARYNERHVAPLHSRRRSHANGSDPARRLKIGYVSPDFRDHAVSHFIAPLLAAHDHARFEIHAYASGLHADAVTARLRPLTDRWHDVGARSDEELAAQIRADGIDILVDLTVHTNDHRLLVFARRPAPVQVSWLGYAGTSGVEGIDYRFTDAFIDPPNLGLETAWSSEEPVRLPDGWCCYEPAADAPAVGPLPALGSAARGAVTFGSLNQTAKHQRNTLRLWARVLAAVPGSRLLIYNPDPEGQRLARAEFEAAGIAGERVLFAARLSKRACLQAYNELFDIGLDPYPHHGMTTTCEALWMGVPVVSLLGKLPISRTGLSLLTAVGLPELVAPDEDSYVQIAATLANDLPRLADLRAGLRERMRASALMDGPRFARHVETAYRAMWRRWCQQRSTIPPASTNTVPSA